MARKHLKLATIERDTGMDRLFANGTVNAAQSGEGPPLCRRRHPARASAIRCGHRIGETVRITGWRSRHNAAADCRPDRTTTSAMAGSRASTARQQWRPLAGLRGVDGTVGKKPIHSGVSFQWLPVFKCLRAHFAPAL